MTPPKQIPESKIALNPIVIDDSKRGLPPQNKTPNCHMILPEGMVFSIEEIPERKFVITDSQLRKFYDAWMYSTKDVRELIKFNDIIRSRIISIGHMAGTGIMCAHCHMGKTSGYFLCEDCLSKIENSRINQRPHVPQGWDEV